MCHRRAHRASGIGSLWFLCLLSLTLLQSSAGPAWAQLQISFDGGTSIFDGGAGDLDSVANGKIDFAGIYGLAGYQVSGTLRESPPWAVGPSISQQLSAPIYSLTLTNFMAEAVSTSTLGTTLSLRFNSAPFVGAYPAGTAVDSLVAEVGSSTSSFVLPNTDLITAFQSIIADNSTSAMILPATGGILPLGNPVHPGPGTTPYLVTGHGPTATPAFTNPVIYGFMELQLGQTGDQLIMPSSLEIGFTAVPEPSTVALLGTAMACLAGAAVRRRRAARRS
jgi:hypothetical protein